LAQLLLPSQIVPSHAQSTPAPATQAQARPAAVPDDLHLVLMIKTTILALNQANMTGNYSVLRDMGTASFQMTNSSARLAEVFSTLRVRKIDFGGILFFNPKLTTPPSLQEGQVLRVVGFFPTTPEQVNFELAYQLLGDQWMLAGIAVNTAPPSSDNSQISATSGAGPIAEATAGNPGKPGEAKPIRIDLSQPAQTPDHPATPKKPAAKKPKPHTNQTAAAQPAQPAQKPAESEPAEKKPAENKPAEKTPETGSSWNPFAR
jgi:hypothetical protein